MKIPVATYRIQFRDGTTFDDAVDHVSYLKRLGVSHLYASPIFTATSGSTHGYDVTDTNEIDPAIGGREGFDRLVSALHAEGLGLILDIVPNHMAASLENHWWRDVVEFGPSSHYARYFDIDWSRKLTLPFLGDAFDAVLDKGEISLKLDPTTGKPALAYFDSLYPLNPSTYSDLERDLLEHADRQTVASLHAQQCYELMSWRDAPKNLSYRRFFEITGLVGMRVEDQLVFDETHRLILELVHSGAVAGLRVDHVDGLADPKAYLERLRNEAGPDCYIIVEKILGEGERVPRDWPISGTTGYEFIAALSDALVDGQKLGDLRGAYQDIVSRPGNIEEELRSAKSLMVDENFEGEFATLLKLAENIRELERSVTVSPVSRLKNALREILLGFPVYRTYGTRAGMPPEGRALLASVLRPTGGHSVDVDQDAISFFEKILCAEVLPISAETAAEFRTRFQQLTGPLMAKSVEDTLFFRHHLALALNEVGAEPLPRIFSVDRFHRKMIERLELQPHGLSSTATHDTKRGEDARARLYTITEAPQMWAASVARWRAINKPYVKGLAAGPAPEPAVEWMLYQSLAGVWPIDAQPADESVLAKLEKRLTGYTEKALREAKLRTNWSDVDEDYEAAVIGYVRGMLSRENQTFLVDFSVALQPFARAGLVNSLTQTIIKFTAPGVPDIYQGSEVSDYSLVDPDNRRKPDFTALRQRLVHLDSFGTVDDICSLGGSFKQRLVQQLLRLRQSAPTFFECADYIPLTANADEAGNIVAFARTDGEHALIVVAPRLPLSSLFEGSLADLGKRYAEIVIALPQQLANRSYRNLWTGDAVALLGLLQLRDVLGGLPFAVLTTIDVPTQSEAGTQSDQIPN